MKLHEPPPVQCLVPLTSEQRRAAPGAVKPKFSRLLEEMLIVHFWKVIWENAFSILPNV